ncbi:MAG: luciferase family protein [Planctomycetota bacterium]
MSSWVEKLSAELAKVPGVFLQKSKFSEAPAYFADGKELLHFHGDAAVDLRLGRKLIRARREELKTDERVELRKSSSADWVEVSMSSKKDVAFVVELVRAALAI